MDLVLSLFPGIGLLDRAFEAEGYCVVRGPDVIWGGDVRDFHPPSGRFDGVIGGPPCQEFSALAPLVRVNGNEPRFGNLIPEYERVVREASPAWFVMENVRGAPIPSVAGYDVWAELVRDADVGGVQPRVRRISLGLRAGTWQSIASPFTRLRYKPGAAERQRVVRGGSGTAPVSAKIRGSGKRQRSVLSEHRPTRREARAAERQRVVLGGNGAAPGQRDRMDPETAMARPNIGDMLEAQGFPRDLLDHAPFTMQGKRIAVGNGVPLAMGQAIAELVRAMDSPVRRTGALA